MGCPGRDEAAAEHYSESSVPSLTSGAACLHSWADLWCCFPLSHGCVQVAKGLILHGAEHSLVWECGRQAQPLSSFLWIRPGFGSPRGFLCKRLAESRVSHISMFLLCLICTAQWPSKAGPGTHENCFAQAPMRCPCSSLLCQVLAQYLGWQYIKYSHSDGLSMTDPTDLQLGHS